MTPKEIISTIYEWWSLLLGISTLIMVIMFIVKAILLILRERDKEDESDTDLEIIIRSAPACFVLFFINMAVKSKYFLIRLLTCLMLLILLPCSPILLIYQAICLLLASIIEHGKSEFTKNAMDKMFEENNLHQKEATEEK